MEPERMPDAPPATSIEAAIRDFVDGFSIESTPHALDEVDAYPDYMPAGTAIYVAHPPNCELDEVLSLAGRLAQMGYAPVPHLVARKLAGAAELDRALGEMRDAGIERILIVGGDIQVAVGPYASTLDVLETGLVERHGFTTVGIAGHPQGSRAITSEELRWALAEKVRRAADSGIDLYIVTQFGFDPQAVVDWEQGLRAEGIGLPIHVGMAGRAPVAQLLRYAVRCGISSSMRIFAEKASGLAKSLRPAPVDELVVAFAQHRMSHADCRMQRAHFYAFGGAERTVRWLNAVSAGDFRISADGRRVETG